jgi:hypothetical protein
MWRLSVGLCKERSVRANSTTGYWWSVVENLPQPSRQLTGTCYKE